MFNMFETVRVLFNHLKIMAPTISHLSHKQTKVNEMCTLFVVAYCSQCEFFPFMNHSSNTFLLKMIIRFHLTL